MFYQNILFLPFLLDNEYNGQPLVYITINQRLIKTYIALLIANSPPLGRNVTRSDFCVMIVVRK